MSKFHSTVSRRDFMKRLGLAGAGLGAAAAAAPVFRDLDEVIASPQAMQKRPWYVKDLPLQKPTVEIDWSLLGPRNEKDFADQRYNKWDSPEAEFSRQNSYTAVEKFYKDRYPEWQGNTLRDSALIDATGAVRISGHLGEPVEGLLGPLKVKTPEERGVPKWQGTPEDNLRMIRSALRLFGAVDVGCVELNADTRKLIWAHDAHGKEFVFEDVPRAYETEHKKVIPNTYRYMIVFINLMPTELTYVINNKGFGPGKAAYNSGHFFGAIITHQAQSFIRGLGYEGLNGYGAELSPSNPFGALSGAGEHARMAQILISPEWGSSIKCVGRILTDLPVAFTPPMDAGIGSFCRTCKICAEEGCPFGSLPTGDATWDVSGPQRPGYKGWRVDLHTCTFCMICQDVCPFTTKDYSFTHSVIKPTIATTSIFNGFFTAMGKAFKYGQQNPESWWDLQNEPAFGINKQYVTR